MWYEKFPKEWTWNCLWRGLVRCHCLGIQPLHANCPVCNSPPPKTEWITIQETDGTKYEVPVALMGADYRYEDWVYLQMLEREWLRSITDADRFINIIESARPSPRAILVLVFWTYFETKVERIFRQVPNVAMSAEELEKLLRKYFSIGSRLDKLYRHSFSTTYFQDLNDLGYGHIAKLLEDIQAQRNRFAHGHPEAINDVLVEQLVTNLKDEHDSWIAVFNKRISVSLKKSIESNKM